MQPKRTLEQVTLILGFLFMLAMQQIGVCHVIHQTKGMVYKLGAAAIIMKAMLIIHTIYAGQLEGHASDSDRHYVPKQRQWTWHQPMIATIKTMIAKINAKMNQTFD